jgi:hypothetical protein
VVEPVIQASGDLSDLNTFQGAQAGERLERDHDGPHLVVLTEDEPRLLRWARQWGDRGV